MNAISNWFTPTRRESIYAAIAAIAPVLVTLGFISQGWVQPILVIASAVLQAFSGIIQLIHLKPTDAARWFGTVGRGIIYGGATTVAAAIVAMGLITNDFASTALTYLSFGLTAFAAILGIVTPKDVSVVVSPTDPAPVGPVEASDQPVVEDSPAPATVDVPDVPAVQPDVPAPTGDVEPGPDAS